MESIQPVTVDHLFPLFGDQGQVVRHPGCPVLELFPVLLAPESSGDLVLAIRRDLESGSGLRGEGMVVAPEIPEPVG